MACKSARNQSNFCKKDAADVGILASNVIGLQSNVGLCNGWTKTEIDNFYGFEVEGAIKFSEQKLKKRNFEIFFCFKMIFKSLRTKLLTLIGTNVN